MITLRKLLILMAEAFAHTRNPVFDISALAFSL